MPAHKIHKIILITVFMAILFIVPVITLVADEQSFSENENRFLAKKPEFNLDRIFSGKFMTQTQTFLEDQLFLREKSITLKTEIQQKIGNKEINGVYLCKDHYFVEKWATQDYKPQQLSRNIESINDFRFEHKDQKVSVLIVPTAGLILKDKLPENAPMFDQNIAFNTLQTALENCQWIDVREVFHANRNQYIYYKTDHHWTSKGAYLAYEVWREAFSDEEQMPEFEKVTASENFLGSLYSKVLNENPTFDQIVLYKNKSPNEVSIHYNFGKTESDSLFEYANLDKKDQYQVFLNGNHPELTIKTAQQNGKHLLVFKDSFANAFIPFMTDDYESIHVIDLRYFNKNLRTYISENNITEFLFLYNIKNFAEETALTKINF